MNMIPEGTWRARAVTAELGYTSQEHEQIGVLIQFLPDQHEDVDSRQTTWYGQFTEKATPHTLKAMRTFGWSTNDLSDLSGIDANEVDVVVKHEEDQEGNWRARAVFINPPGGGGVAMKAKMSSDQAKAFAERMRGNVLASAAKSSPPPTKPPAATTTKATTKPPKATPTKQQRAAEVQPPEDDNVPF